jgi:hypothetical protein
MSGYTQPGEKVGKQARKDMCFGDGQEQEVGGLSRDERGRMEVVKGGGGRGRRKAC